MILFDKVDVLNPKMEVERNRYVLVDGNRISSIAGVRPQGSFERVISGSGRVMMPGFYNAHAHSAMTLMRGYGENLVLSDWLSNKIFPFEDKLTAEAVYQGTLLAIAESFRSGIISSTDMYYFCEDEARAVLESGAKSNIAQGFVSFNADENPADNPRFAVTRKLYEGFHGSGDGRVLIDVSLHAEYTSHEKFVIAVADLAKELNTGMQVHISETQNEHEESKQRHEGRTPARYFADCGLFDVRTTAAHCVWVDEDDMDIFVDKGVYVASCPVSNLKLASGICDVPKLKSKGVSIAIGTDSVASNNNLSMIEEMKFFALVNKERYSDPTLVSPAEAIIAATRTGALSQGRVDCGIISEGMKADLILIDVDQPNMVPSYDFASNLVYAADAGNVKLTMIDGRVVYENGEWPTVDVAKIKQSVVKEAENIISQL